VSHDASSKVSILLADDNPANLLVLHSLLDELGHHLVEARVEKMRLNVWDRDNSL
jgi:CheY-like chemotaxis protein